MMIKIGIVAGEILDLLEGTERSLTVDEIEQRLNEPYEMVLMSLGLLVRKGLIEIEDEGNGAFLIKNRSDNYLEVSTYYDTHADCQAYSAT